MAVQLFICLLFIPCLHAPAIQARNGDGIKKVGTCAASLAIRRPEML